MGIGVLVFAAVASAQLTFRPALEPGVIEAGMGGPQSAIVSADLNRDGIADVAATQGNTVQIRIWGGAGFTGSQNVGLGAGAEPTDLAVGDFNHNGRLDLAAVDPVLDRVAIIHQGSFPGEFEADSFPDLGAGADPASIAVGDVNRDGAQDLVTADEGLDRVSVLLGNGDGTFAAPVSFAVGGGPRSVALADFDNDGALDIATVDADDETVSVLLNDGSGGFGAPSPTPLPGEPSDLVAGDFDGNGDRDLAVAVESTSQVAVLLGDGAGGLAAPTTFAAGGAPTGIARGDVDGDGFEDVVTANPASNQLAVLAGDGSGGLAAPESIAVADQPGDVAMADFDGDGSPDLAASRLGASSAVALLGDADGTFFGVPVEPYVAGGGIPFGAGDDFIDSGQLNHLDDSDADLVVATATGVAIFFGNGDGTLSGPTNLSSGPGNAVWAVKIADVDDDGNQDLVTANVSDDSISVLLGNGDGTFAAPIVTAMGDGPNGLGIGDFDDDGDLDVATTDINDSTITARLGNGDGTFQAAEVLPSVANTRTIEAGDFDGDGNDDLAVAISLNLSLDPAVGSVSVYQSNGDGTFGPRADHPATEPGDSGTQGLEIADLDGDTNLDLVTANRFGGGVSVLLGDGGGGFDPAAIFNQAPFLGSDNSVEVGDLDGDGELDVASVHDETDQMTALLGDGQGGLSFAGSFGVNGDFPRALTIADLDGDGRPDVATSNQTDGGTVSVMLNLAAPDDPPETTIEIHPPALSLDDTPTFSFHASQVGSSFECSIDDGTPDFVPCSGPQNLHTSDPLAPGEYTFRVRATNSLGITDPTPATFEFTIPPPPPVCSDLERSTGQAEALAISLDCTGGGELTYEIVDTPGDGQLSDFDAAAGTVTYTPEAAFTGETSFTFRASNLGGTSELATATITVQAAPPCGGLAVTIVGTPGDDMIVGTPGPDVIHGLGGDDVIWGLDGDDVICGGAGNDRLIGGSGDDQLFGGAGNDRLQGGSGDDRLFGGAGNDRLKGGPGRDLLRGGPGRDRLVGWQGADRLFGGPGPDSLFGGRGNDRLFGGPGNDRLFGGPGADLLVGGPGRNLLRGGHGRDTLRP